MASYTTNVGQPNAAPRHSAAGLSGLSYSGRLQDSENKNLPTNSQGLPWLFWFIFRKFVIYPCIQHCWLVKSIVGEERQTQGRNEQWTACFVTAAAMWRHISMRITATYAPLAQFIGPIPQWKLRELRMNGKRQSSSPTLIRSRR